MKTSLWTDELQGYWLMNYSIVIFILLSLQLAVTQYIWVSQQYVVDKMS